MQKQSFLLGLGAAALVGTLAIAGASSANAEEQIGQQGPQRNEERHAEMTEIFENNDFEGWKTLMEERNPVNIIDTQEEFDKLSEAHQLMIEGDHEGAQAIREELGLRGGHGPRGGMGKGERMGNGDCPNAQ